MTTENNAMRRANPRQDFLTRKPCLKNQAVRFVEAKGVISLDETGKKEGRGAYLAFEEVLEALSKKAFSRPFHRALRQEEEEAIKASYEKLQKR
jgi:predicted RNA-binding protein YlxR (DUF448 family)